jgi:hypothetical protein
MFPGINSCRGYCPVVPIPDPQPSARSLYSRIFTLRSALGLKYGRQRDTAALAVAELTSVRQVRDEIEIGYDADRSTSPGWCRTPWTATRWSPTTATSPSTPAATR